MDQPRRISTFCALWDDLQVGQPDLNEWLHLGPDDVQGTVLIKQVEDTWANWRWRLRWQLLATVRPRVDRKTGVITLVPFESNPASVNHALESIHAFTHLPATIEMPSWLDTDSHPPALELVAGRTSISRRAASASLGN